MYLVKPFIGMEKFGDILWSGGKEPLVLKVLDALLGFLIEPVEKKHVVYYSTSGCDLHNIQML